MEGRVCGVESVSREDTVVLDDDAGFCSLESSPVPGKCDSVGGQCKRRGRPCNSNAARERSRVKTLRTAFLELQQTLPSVPPDTKLSKLDVLVLATTYISHLMRTLDGGQGKRSFSSQGFMHPVKKWPMRTRLYAGILASTDLEQTYSHRSSNSPTPDSRSGWRQ